MRLWFERALLPMGWCDNVRIVVQDGTIETVETGTQPTDSDELYGAVVPGLCNVHSHGFQRGMAGLSERRGSAADDFWSWREVVYRFLDRLTPDDIEAITAQAYLEMIESGFTRVGEFHYLHNDVAGAPYADPGETAGAVVAAAEATGIGLALLPVFYAHGDFGGAPAGAGQRRFLSDLDGFARIVESCRAKLPADGVLGIAPHSLRAVTPGELTAILPFAGDGPVHIHAAEQVREVEGCLAWSGARPVQWLLDKADVNERWCLIHATHVDEAERGGLADSGAVAGLCPITEANLGDGVFPATDYLARGGRFGVGTDSNVLVSAAGELRALEYSQRLTNRKRALLADEAQSSVGTNLYTRAVAGGAQALGAPGALEAGNAADMVSLDLDHPAMIGATSDLLDRWIFAARTSPIDCVWRGGRRIVEAGRHVSAGAVEQRYRATIRKLLG